MIAEDGAGVGFVPDDEVGGEAFDVDEEAVGFDGRGELGGPELEVFRLGEEGDAGGVGVVGEDRDERGS